VKVNGHVRNDPEFPVSLERDQLTVGGESVARSQSVYIMLNKPRGIVTTASDEEGRETVYSLLPQDLPWIAPVGRLDKASEGLLLLTNDSEWAARITDPRSHLGKTYHVQIAAQPADELLRDLTTGISSNGERLRAHRVSVLRVGEKNCWLEIVLDEGRNRQIRRMLDAMGIEVLRLVRVSIGPLQLGDLPKGSFRALQTSEKQAMDRGLAE
jgi:23S rRNA pseudouridine2605 synthase